jgi:hypothetical protein
MNTTDHKVGGVFMSAAASRHSRRQASSKADAICRAVRLLQQFPELPVEALEAVVNRRYHVFDGRPIRDFIPILVEHAAREDLNGGHPSTA